MYKRMKKQKGTAKSNFNDLTEQADAHAVATSSAIYEVGDSLTEHAQNLDDGFSAVHQRVNDVKSEVGGWVGAVYRGVNDLGGRMNGCQKHFDTV